MNSLSKFYDKSVSRKILLIISILTIAFLVIIAFDLLPFFRGPAPYPPEWQWPYLYVNTWSKIYAPLAVFLGLIYVFFASTNKNGVLQKNKNLLLLIGIILAFLIQLSILHFSRTGIFILLGRIIHPEINGYFTAASDIDNVYIFLKTFNNELLNFAYHAKSHPPGSMLFFYMTKHIVAPFESLFPFVDLLSPSHERIRLIWESLSRVDKLNALFSPFFIVLLSSLSVIPTYLCAKTLYGETVAVRCLFLLFLIPTLVFFIPINDAFLHIFSITAFYFLILALRKLNYIYFMFSGLILFLGVFFNLSLLPVAVIFFFFSLFYLIKNKILSYKNIVLSSFAFAFGLFSPLAFLYFTFDFNFLEMVKIIMSTVPDIHTRSPYLWLYFNIHDFLIFLGIPVAISFIALSYENFRKIALKKWSEIDILSLSVLLMIIILNFSNSVRGETGRLWIPYIPFVVIVASYYLTSKIKFSNKHFAIFLTLMFAQLIVMQEFWVMLW